MLYSINQIQAKIASNPLYKEKKVAIIQFFNVNNLIEKLNINVIYTSDNHPPLLLSEKDINFVFSKASESFNLPFEISSFYEGKMPLLKIEQSEGIAHQVRTKEDLDLVLSNHSESSSYGKKEQEKESIKKAQKERKVAILQAEIDARKEKEKAEFNRATNLLRDFVNEKVVSIDFEFFITKDETHEPTELGISINEDGKINTYHFLIKENYLRKKNKALQNKFNFGETQVISQAQIPTMIEHALQDAKYVLFHEQREESKIFEQLGISIPTHIDILDTQLCYKRYFREKGSLPNGEKLENLLSLFKIQAQDLHNAGNDAYFTLILLQKMSEIQKHIQANKKNSSKMKMR